MTQWTEKQQDVINTRNRNILVSAAAGSGKTAVLVERIIKLVTDEKSPIDIDQLLVVTFTRAAAAEMKERVRESLEKLSEEQPHDINIRRQLSLLHNANISTIDSFCGRVVKENFHKIDIDPNYRIADETEIDMIKSDILEEMLEEKYEAGDEDFENLVQQYSNGKLNDNISELICNLYQKAEKFDDPQKWLESCSKVYEIENVEELENAQWFVDYLEEIKLKLKQHKKNIDDIYEISESKDGPKFGDHIDNFNVTITEILNKSTYSEIRKVVSQFAMVRQLRAVKGSDKEKTTQCQNVLNKAKTYIQDELKKKIFNKSIQEVFEEIQLCKNTVDEIISLTEEFSERLAAIKKEKAIMDFNDQAHAALNILKNRDVAVALSKQYKEIMIDEYQDSNYIQEAILTAIANGFGINNMFMVGDVKQSIYRFRNAEPKLFLEKYNLYQEDLTAKNCKIILDKNFRSREEIINSVNYIFNHIMQKRVGGIDYTNGNQLFIGANYPDLPVNQNNATEIIAIEGSSKEIEAEYVAQKIAEITNPNSGMKVTGKDGKLRNIKYSDIAILLRSVKTNAQMYLEHLENNGIPATADMKTGYYEAVEINTIMSMLQIIDNPRQDIELATVMVSPMFDFDVNELAIIKNEVPGDCLYERINSYDINGNNQALKLKIREFLNVLNKFRKLSNYVSVYDLINMILEETDFEYYVKAMSNGKRRYLNIEALKEKAVSYDQTSYKGLFNFVRYIEKIKMLAKDEGEASVVGEEDDAVKIMTIHKSKGLQFPVVFLCNTNSKSVDDGSGKIIFSDKGLIGVDAIDTKLRTKSKTIMRQYIASDILKEQKAEDLRLLYVALTRAQEKLFITGKVNKLEDEINMMKMYGSQSTNLMSYEELTENNTFWYWISRTISKNKAFDIGIEQYRDKRKQDILYKVDADILFNAVTEDEILYNMAEAEVKEKHQTDIISDLKNYEISDEAVSTKIKENFDFVYPYEAEIHMPSKASVTEIKKQSMTYEEEIDGNTLFEKELELPELIPEFARDDVKEKSLYGAKRGTAYHRVFELLDVSKKEHTYESIKEDLTQWVLEGKMAKAEADCIYIKNVLEFTNSSLYKRMQNAHSNNVLFREQKFLLTRAVKDLYNQLGSKEPMIMQGIIDVCFIEDGKYVIADYKTDKVANMQELVDQYKVQLECYQIAIKQITGKEVSEKIIYSVTLDDEVSM